MDNARPVLDQINIVSGNVAASIEFYRRLGVTVPDARGVWETPSGIHHLSAETNTRTMGLDIDSTAFAQVWNTGWKGRDDLAGRVVIGFKLPSRAAIDNLYRDMTAAGHRGLQPPYDALWGARYAVLEDPDGIAVGLMSPIDDARKSPPPAL